MPRLRYTAKLDAHNKVKVVIVSRASRNTYYSARGLNVELQGRRYHTVFHANREVNTDRSLICHKYMRCGRTINSIDMASSNFIMGFISDVFRIC